MARRSIVIVTALLIAGASALVATALRSSRKPADHVEPAGAFGIVTHYQQYTTGWNEGRLREATTESYSLRHRGKPFTFEGKSGMFGDDTRIYETMNAVITVGERDPVLIVNVGDPNNSSFFYLVREIEGQPRVDFLGMTSGNVSADFLESSATGTSRERHLAVHRKKLDGGRNLLLGDFTVFDVETLAAHTLTWNPEASIDTLRRPLALAPDGRSFVRLGYGEQNAPVLLVFAFVEGSSYVVPIDRSVQRFSTIDDIDSGWLEHYFEWRDGEASTAPHALLISRTGVTPRPWRGNLTVDPNDGYREYRIEPVEQEMTTVVLTFLQDEMKAEIQPRQQYATSDTLKIGDRTVHVMFWENRVGLWMDRGTDSTLVEEIARRFDTILATGTHDLHFLD